MQGGTLDLAIIGAGVAGLAAGEAARTAGLSFAILEAKDRIGGRAWTESTSLGAPFDHGAHFLHVASENPFRAKADALGLRYLRGGYPARTFDGRWLDDREAAEAETTLRRGLATVAAAGRTGDGGSAAAAWAPLAGRATLARGIYEEFLGARAEDVDAAEHARYRDTYEDWPMAEGFGNLVARWAADVPVILGCPALSIDTRGTAIRIETPRGTLFARHVLVTVSTGVLAAGAIRFLPELPDWKRAAVEAVPMGYAGKVAFRLEEGPLAGVEPHHGLVAAGDLFANVHIRPFGKPVAVAIVGGPDWQMIERAGPAAMAAAARDVIASAHGAAAAAGLHGAVSTAWLGDPHVRGGHSYKRPTAGNARGALAESIDARLHFAGEACSAEAWATVHGAYATARAAVARIIEREKT